MKTNQSRRHFLQTSAVAASGFLAFAGNAPKPVRASALQDLAVAGIGIGGKGHGDITQAGYYARVLAVCDVDRNTLEGVGKEFPDAKQYVDYRELFAEMGDKIDAATISTTDHMHAVQTAAAMKLGKHVYTQKPLTRTIWEARRLAQLAKEKNLCTQMGNQGSAEQSLRDNAAQLRAGVIGAVKEVHISTDRPIWPQGPNRKMTLQRFSDEAKAADAASADAKIDEMKAKIAEAHKRLEWDLWLGVAPEREFWPGIYHSFVWRGWWDFGTGALGDIACHSCNHTFKAFGLYNPVYAQATSSGHDFDSFPLKSVVEIGFGPTESRGAAKFVWYDGNTPIPKSVYEKYGVENAGMVVIGEKGAAFGGSFKAEGGAEIPRLENVEPYRAAALDEAHSDGDSRHKKEWIDAIREGKPENCWSNFVDNAGPLTETVLMGNLAVWTASEADQPGERIEWDPATMSVTNADKIKTPKTLDLIKPTFREGYPEL